VVEAAAHAADRAAELRRLWRQELAHDEPRPSILAKFAAEARLSERAVADLAHRVDPGLGGPPKSTVDRRAVAGPRSSGLSAVIGRPTGTKSGRHVTTARADPEIQ
jgi:hypothetical protein